MFLLKDAKNLIHKKRWNIVMTVLCSKEKYLVEAMNKMLISSVGIRNVKRI